MQEYTQFTYMHADLNVFYVKFITSTQVVLLTQYVNKAKVINAEPLDDTQLCDGLQ